MDDFGNDLSGSGAVLSHAELVEKRQRDGLCVKCGQQCHKKKALKLDKKLFANAVLDRLEPLTVDGRVLNGRCLICNPQTKEELAKLERERLAASLVQNVAEDGASGGGGGGDGHPSEAAADARKKKGLFAKRTSRTGSTELGGSEHGDDGAQSPPPAVDLSHDKFFEMYEIPASRSFHNDDGSGSPGGRLPSRSGSHDDAELGMRSRGKLPSTGSSPDFERLLSQSSRAEFKSQRKNGAFDDRKFNKGSDPGGGTRGSREKNNNPPNLRSSVHRDGQDSPPSRSISHGSLRRSAQSSSRGGYASAEKDDARINTKRPETRTKYGNKAYHSFDERGYARRSKTREAKSSSDGYRAYHSFDDRGHTARSKNREARGDRSVSRERSINKGGENYPGNRRARDRRRLSGASKGGEDYGASDNTRGSFDRKRGEDFGASDGTLARQQRSEIGKIRWKSQRRLEKSERSLRHSSRRSSSSSSSFSSSDDDDDSSGSSGSSSSSGDSDDDGSSVSSYELEDGDELPENGMSWREKPTPEEKLRSILDHLANAAAKSALDLRSIREERAGLVEEAQSAKKAKWYASQKVKDAENLQVVAIEEEDYEEADRLGSVILVHLKASKKQTALSWGINGKILKLDRKKETVSRAATLFLKETQSELGELHIELIDCENEDQEIMSRFSAEKSQLSSEAERLAEELKVIEREEELLAEEKNELVGGETKELEEQLKQDSAKLLEVNETILELRKQLAKAEADAAYLNERIAATKESIEHITKKYSKELQQLEMMADLTKEKRTGWASENKRHLQAETEHENNAAAHSSQVMSRQKLMVKIDEESLAAIELEKVVANAFDVEETEKIGDSDDGDDALENDEDDEVVIYEALVDEKQELLFEAETRIDDLVEELSSIEDLIPVLEAKKKAAASSRNFKAASKMVKSIKKATNRKEKCQAELEGDAMEREKIAKEELEKYTTLLEEKKKVVDEEGREAGMKRMEQLEETTSKLKSALTKLASASEEETTKVSLVGGYLINDQLSVLEAEGRALGEKYGGWEETALENDIIEKFRAFPMTETDAPVRPKAPARQRTRLSMLLDKKMVDKGMASRRASDCRRASD